MDEARCKQAIQRLRELANDNSGRSDVDKGSELLELLLAIAKELASGEERRVYNRMHRLVSRSKEYDRTIEGTFFLPICELSTHYVLSIWCERQSADLIFCSDAGKLILHYPEVKRRVDVLDAMPRGPDCESPSPVIESATESQNLVSIRTDLESFSQPPCVASIGFFVTAYVGRLRRISRYFGNPEPLQKIIRYFDRFISIAKSRHTWGSFWIRYCGKMAGPWDMHHAMMFPNVIEGEDLPEIAKAIAAATERLLEEEITVQTSNGATLTANEPAPPTPAQGQKQNSLETEGAASRKKNSRNKKGTYWHSPYDPVDDNKYHLAYLEGAAVWQIAWALREARITNSYTEKHLTKQLAKETHWGTDPGIGNFRVRVSKLYSTVYLERAIEALNRIMDRGPYKHPKQQLSPKYRNNKDLSLKSHSREILAHVLYKAGFIENDKVTTLHNFMESNFSGQFDNDQFIIVFHDKHIENNLDKVKKAHKLLNEAHQLPDANQEPS